MKKNIFFFMLVVCALLGSFSLVATSFVTSGEWDLATTLDPKANQKEYLVLITGCGRSGTTYIAKLLQRCGLDVQHECMGRHGSASWFLAGDIPQIQGVHFQHVFHQVRHPLKVIASVETISEKSWHYICQHAPQISMQDPLIVRAAKYWVYWNKKAEAHAHWTYRIEDIDVEFDEIGKRLGVKLDRKALDFVPEDTNTRPHRELTWKQLREEIGPHLFQQVKKLAIRYGYQTNDS